MFLSTLLGVLLSVASNAFGSEASPIGDPITTGSNEIKVLTYNVENLFDTNHDLEKNDYTFLPLHSRGKKENCLKIPQKHYRIQCLETDWIGQKLQLKLRQIRKVIRAQGTLPDILALQEVENETVVGELANIIGYKYFFLTNSPDKRGIDVALLYRDYKLHYIEHKEIVLNGPEFSHGPTRNILRVHFRLLNDHNAVFGVYVNHWPSQGASSEKRVAAALVLRKEIDLHTREIGESNYYVMAVGDFNTLPNESPNAISDVLRHKSWPLNLKDAQESSEQAHNPVTNLMPPASYWYSGDKRWNRLDRILFSKNLLNGSGIELIPDSFRIFAAPFMTKLAEEHLTVFLANQFVGIPFGYNFATTTVSELGYSDHFPVLVKIKFN